MIKYLKKSILTHLKKFEFLYILKGFLKYRRSYYFYFKKWYVAPSLRQSQILKSYVISNDLYKKRETGPNYFLNKISSDKPAILDIGGSMGYSALHYSRFLQKNGSGVCFSFEPISKNFSKMIFNFGHLSNIFFFRLGISNKTKILKFGLPDFFDNSHDFNSGLYTSKNVNSRFDIEECRVTSLDSFLDFINTKELMVEYIKIDIEGSEFEAINGSTKLLENYSPVIQMEYNPDANSKIELIKIINHLRPLHYFAYKIKSSEVENHGYEVFFIKNDSLNIFLKDNEFNNEFEPALVD